MQRSCLLSPAGPGAAPPCSLACCSRSGPSPHAPPPAQSFEPAPLTCTPTPWRRRYQARGARTAGPKAPACSRPAGGRAPPAWRGSPLAAGMNRGLREGGRSGRGGWRGQGRQAVWQAGPAGLQRTPDAGTRCPAHGTAAAAAAATAAAAAAAVCPGGARLRGRGARLLLVLRLLQQRAVHVMEAGRKPGMRGLRLMVELRNSERRLRQQRRRQRRRRPSESLAARQARSPVELHAVARRLLARSRLADDLRGAGSAAAC